MRAPLKSTEWIENRRNYIGGSEIGIILGINPHKTAYRLWQEKLGLIEREDLSENNAVVLGNILENAVAELFEHRTGFKVRKTNQTKFSKRHPYFGANVDRTYRDKDRRQCILEIKTVSAYAYREWKEAIPQQYYAQLQWYLGIYGYKRGSFAVFIIDSRKLEIIEVNFDSEYFGYLSDVAFDFWQCIQTGTPPPLTLPDYVSLKELSEIPAQADAEQIEIYNELLKVRNIISDLETKEETLTNQLKEYMKDSPLLLFGQKKLASWNVVTSSRFDSAKFKSEHPELYSAYKTESTSRRFLINQQPKENGK